MSTRACPLVRHRLCWRVALTVASLFAASCAAAPMDDAVAPSPPRASASAQAADTAQSLAAASLTVEVLREGLWGERTATEEGQGSGFVVTSREGPLVVTAAHVVYGATEIVVVDSTGRRTPVVDLLSLDEEADVAVLRAEGLSPGVRALPTGPAPAVGEKVILVSSPLGLSSTVAFGTVAAARSEHKALQLAAGVSPGSSGGLVADAQGRAVAIIRSKASAAMGGENITIATPVSFALESLSDGRAARLPERPNQAKMADVERHRLLTTRGKVFESYPAAAGVTYDPGKRELAHVCARADASDVVLAIREIGREDPSAWRQGSGHACATVVGGAPIEVWVGTQKVGRKVDLIISRQP